MKSAIAVKPGYILIPVISMWMPWAYWVKERLKPIETRTHRRFAGLLGKRIGIHIAGKFDESAYIAAAPYLSEEQRKQANNFSYRAGVISCTALVKEFRELTDADSPRALIDCGSVKRYGLFLEDVKPLKEEYVCKGRQGIWYEQIPTELFGGPTA
jgi:hypothetical protein